MNKSALRQIKKVVVSGAQAIIYEQMKQRIRGYTIQHDTHIHGPVFLQAVATYMLSRHWMHPKKLPEWVVDLFNNHSETDRVIIAGAFCASIIDIIITDAPMEIVCRPNPKQ